MNKHHHILVLAGWSWNDALIQVYTLPYVRIMRRQFPPSTRIDLVTMEQPGMKPGSEELLAIRKALASEGIHWVPLPYRTFGLTGILLWGTNFLRLLTRMYTRRIACVHAWCMPAGALGSMLAMAGRSKLVIDSFEPHAEAMVENKTWKAGGLRYRLLFAMERRLARKADAVVAVTAAMKTYAQDKYGTVPVNFFVKPACVDLDYYARFPVKEAALLQSMGFEGKIVGLYAGKFGGIYLGQEIFDFFKVAEDRWGDRFRLLLLSGATEEQLAPWIISSGFSRERMTLKRVLPSEMPRYLGLADFALTPVKPVPTKRYCTPIKDGEYWAMGLPVVITAGISDDSDLIRQHRAGHVLESLDRAGYEDAIRTIETLLSDENREKVQAAARELARKHRDLTSAVELYRCLYATLFPA